RVAAVEAETSRAVAHHAPLEALFEQPRHDPDLLLHHLIRILDEGRLVTAVVVGQLNQRRRVPRMQVHADLARIALEEVAAELEERRTGCYLVIDEIDGPVAEALAQRLKARQEAGVAGGDLVGP